MVSNTQQVSVDEVASAKVRAKFIQNLINDFKSGKAHLSYSALTKFKRSPSSFINYKMKVFETTDSMLLGQLVHALVLEPEKVDQMFFTDAEKVAEIGGGNPRLTKVYKEWKAEQIELYPNKTLVSSDTLELAKKMAFAVLNNKASKFILSKIHQKEHAIEFTHNGITIKSILDGVGEVIVDLKVCTDAEPRKFQRDIINNNYHLQAGVYTTGIGEILPYYIIAVDREGEVSVHHLMEDLVMKGVSIFEKLIGEFCQCIDSGDFSQSFEYRAVTEEGVYKMDVPPYLN